MTRRGLLASFTLGAFGTITAFATGATAAGRFFFPNVPGYPPEEFIAGDPNEYPPGTVSNRFKDRYRVWVVHLGDRLVAILAICTHLGCTPNWLDNQEIYKCPCHGSGFYKNGVNFEGPAPRPLDRVGIRLNSDRYSARPGWNSNHAYILV